MLEQSDGVLPFEAVAGLSLGEAAMAYAEASVPVFPCRPGTKIPATEHGFYDATTDPAQVVQWWERQPEANIAIATGTVVEVLDVDVHPGGTGFPALRMLHEADLVNHWINAVRTPSGGLHLYYPVDPDRPQQSWSRGRSHIDVRAAGGYVVTVPSRRTIDDAVFRYEPVGQASTGGRLDGERIRQLLTPQVAPRPRPQSLEPADAGARVEQLRSWLAGAVEGNRNASLFWAACRMVELGANETDTLAQLGEIAEHTGLGEPEIRSTIHSAHRTTTNSDLSPTPSARRGAAPVVRERS